MTHKILLTPPFALILLTSSVGLLLYLFGRLSLRNGPPTGESNKAYSCGEQFSGHMIQPDYSQFFPFAFFFTMLHVVALVVATVPVETIESFAIAVAYIIGAAVGLSILLRK